MNAITEPGVYADLTHEDYLADPVPGGSLSNSGAKLLLPPGCPALFKYRQDHPEPHKDEFDLGTAAHTVVLGVGRPLHVIHADDWRTKAAREERDAAYTAGETPVLPHQFEAVREMATALIEHPFAGQLFGSDGQVELSAFWPDPDTGVMRRCRYDWIGDLKSGRRAVVDYKTGISAEPDACAKAMHNYAYHGQGAWYLDGAVACGLGDPDTVFLLVFQERTPPYLVTVTQPDQIALSAGRERNRRAIDLYADCKARDQWPGYADDVIPLSLPPWAEKRYLEETYR